MTSMTGFREPLRAALASPMSVSVASEAVSATAVSATAVSFAAVSAEGTEPAYRLFGRLGQHLEEMTSDQGVRLSSQLLVVPSVRRQLGRGEGADGGVDGGRRGQRGGS